MGVGDNRIGKEERPIVLAAYLGGVLLLLLEDQRDDPPLTCPRELYTRRAEALAAAYREANSEGAGGVILEVRAGGGNGGSRT